MKTKNGVLFLLPLIMVSILAGCSVLYVDDPVVNKSVAGMGDPEVFFTYIPPAYTGSYVQGHVSNITTVSDYKLCLWIYVPGWGWVPKPYYASWVTGIAADHSWSTTFYTGGHDYDATYMIMYLLPSDYPSYADIYTLAHDSVCYTVINRPDIATGAIPQVRVTNTINTQSNYVFVCNVKDYTNVALYVNAWDDYYLDGVGVSINYGSFQYIRKDKDLLFVQNTNFKVEVTLHPGSNTVSYFAKDQGLHTSVTNEVTVYCASFQLPVISGDIIRNPRIFNSPSVVNGTAQSEAGIAQVFAFTNGCPVTVTGTTNWSMTMAADPGRPTTFTIYCLDKYGTSSVTQTMMVYNGIE